MMDSTRMAASKQAPEPKEKVVRIRGTSTIMPTRPYTTDGMPASSCTAVRITAAALGGASFARKMAVIRPMGTPMTMAPAVPYMEVRMKGRMPYWAPVVVLVGSQTWPNRNLNRPIWRMAGRPEMIRYTLMTSTKPTATMPHSRKIRWITVSRALRAPVFFERIVGSFLVRNGKGPWPGITGQGRIPGDGYLATGTAPAFLISSEAAAEVAKSKKA